MAELFTKLLSDYKGTTVQHIQQTYFNTGLFAYPFTLDTEVIGDYFLGQLYFSKTSISHQSY